MLHAQILHMCTYVCAILLYNILYHCMCTCVKRECVLNIMRNYVSEFVSRTRAPFFMCVRVPFPFVPFTSPTHFSHSPFLCVRACYFFCQTVVAESFSNNRIMPRQQNHNNSSFQTDLPVFDSVWPSFVLILILNENREQEQERKMQGNRTILSHRTDPL